MAYKSEIQYIRLYTDGSAARQYEPPQPKKKPQRQPRPRRQKKLVLHVDLLAAAGILVAGVMLVLMLTGMASLSAVNEDVARMEAQVADLQRENLSLRQTYREGYDLDQIREEALEMGMIPRARAERVQIQVETVIPEQTTVGNKIWAFLTGLFA